MEKHADNIRQALKKNHSIAIFCECSVRYSGRAESFLEKGERVILIKSDNTLIVHQPTGNRPINYMKPGSSHRIDLEKGLLILKSTNIALRENMDIKIHNIHSISNHKLKDGKKLKLKGTEKEMSDMIFNNPEVIEADFKPLSREEHTKYGFIDVFGYDSNNNFVVVECKRFTAGPTGVQQLRRYVERLKKSKGLDKIRGILAAPSITTNAKHMLDALGFEFRTVEPPKFHEEFKKKQKSLDDF